jgi:serine/threonine-protein kinase
MTPSTLTEAPPERPISVGSRIAGYRVDHIVNHRPGLYTTVEATARDGARVSLEVLAEEISRDDQQSERILQLAKLRSSIKHPTLLPVRRSGRQGRRLYIANPIARGRSLADRLAEGPLPVDETVAILDQVSAGLEAAAVRGLVHRELDPANIFLTDGQPVSALLTDFGIAIPEGRSCELVSAVEGADYRSPEEVRGEPISTQSNVYSLGCILVECLTGEPPFPHDRPLLTLHAHLVEQPPRVSDRSPQLPAALDLVVATAMAKDPRDRFDSPSRFILATARAFDLKVTAVPPAVPVAVTKPAEVKRVEPTPVEPKAPEKVPPAKRRRETAHSKREAPRERKAPPTRARARATQREQRPAQREQRPARTRQRGAHRRRLRLTALTTVPVVGVLLALLATSSGFALGRANSSGGSDKPPAPTVALTKPSASAQQLAAAGKAKYVHAVNNAMARLVAARATGRARLSRARLRASQAEAAAFLAQAYKEAQQRLANTSGPPVGMFQLRGELRQAELAYQQLAAAAKNGNAGAYTAARREVSQRESDLEAALGDLARS